jgi:hypothetical protein
MDSDEILLGWNVSWKFIRLAQSEVIERFNLKPPAGYPNYPNYCFVKKNSNRYFRKHLGFTFNSNIKIFKPYITIRILDHKKLMVFRLKYGV